MPWYKAGTVSVTQNSNAVIGAGTAFIANSRVGDGFRGPDGGWYEVTNIASDTAMSIAPNYQGATNGAGGYALAPLQGYVKESADTLRSFVNLYGAKLAALGTTGNYDTLPVDKGGTGANDSGTALINLGLKSGANDILVKSIGLRGAAVGQHVQGLYVGWKSSADAGALAGANFICNRGAGVGGHSWWSVNSDNTSAGPMMHYSYDGVLTAPKVITQEISGLTVALTVAQGGTGTNTGVPVLVGATSGSAGVKGLAPTPQSGDRDKFLKGDGSWAYDGLGMGQVWTDLTTSRALTTAYTNSTNRAIAVSGWVVQGASGFLSCIVGPLTIQRLTTAATGTNTLNFSFIVPPGATYAVSITSGTATLGAWTELR